MRVVVAYESMYGNTHQIAEAIASGFPARFRVEVMTAAELAGRAFASDELLVAGGPTHAHGMPRPRTRAAAVAGAEQPLAVEPTASSGGLREWFAETGDVPTLAAAFDTRISGPAALTGRASKAIARQLQRRGVRLVTAPESFLVDKHNRLLPGELDRARAWGARLATAVGLTGTPVG